MQVFKQKEVFEFEKIPELTRNFNTQTRKDTDEKDCINLNSRKNLNVFLHEKTVSLIVDKYEKVLLHIMSLSPCVVVSCNKIFNVKAFQKLANKSIMDATILIHINDMPTFMHYLKYVIPNYATKSMLVIDGLNTLCDENSGSGELIEALALLNAISFRQNIPVIVTSYYSSYLLEQYSTNSFSISTCDFITFKITLRKSAFMDSFSFEIKDE